LCRSPFYRSLANLIFIVFLSLTPLAVRKISLIMVRPSSKLSANLPPLIFGTATFNYQFNPDPFALGPTEIVQRALAHGVRAFDTSPYYGPAEEILGTAFTTDLVRQHYRRDQYYILTKVGRILADCFDYSPAWVRYSVKRSCKRLRTNYLDVVYCHDVEFVSAEEVLGAVKELRRIRDEEGTIKYVGISGYPVPVLCDLAEMILRETGEPLDVVMSYASFTLQNTRLMSKGVPRLVAAGVDVVPNASPLGMGLLRSQGPPIGAMGNWHPAPDELRKAIKTASDWTDEQGERLEVVAVRFALENWLREGAKVGACGDPLAFPEDTCHPETDMREKMGVSVMGVSKIAELDATLRVWRSVLDGTGDDLDLGPGVMTPSDAVSDHEWSLQRRQRIRVLARGIRTVIGDWADFSWASPDAGFVNKRHDMDTIRHEGSPIAEVNNTKSAAMLTPPSEAEDDSLAEDVPPISC
jgi:aryl-alcohol dehydrogenase-like predicted oxidoreductase